MKYNELNHPIRKKSKRLGRGISAGQGKTAGRGTKGQKARTGYSKRPGFSGGQNPLMQQLPKLPGFKSHKIKAINVFTDQLDDLKVKKIDALTLHQKGLIENPYTKIKLLSRGEIKNAIEISLPSISKSALEQIQNAGGQFNKTPILQRSKKTEDKK